MSLVFLFESHFLNSWISNVARTKNGGRLCRQMMLGGKKDNYGEEREKSLMRNYWTGSEMIIMVPHKKIPWLLCGEQTGVREITQGPGIQTMKGGGAYWSSEQGKEKWKTLRAAEEAKAQTGLGGWGLADRWQ